jgi:hypothetical protein
MPKPKFVMFGESECIRVRAINRIRIHAATTGGQHSTHDGRRWVEIYTDGAGWAACVPEDVYEAARRLAPNGLPRLPDPPKPLEPPC